MNRVIRNWDLDAIYVMGPGHGGPAAVANAYLEGTYSELYPHISPRRSRHGQACSGSSVSRVASPPTLPLRPPVPSTRAGSSATRLSHAFGAAFDNPGPARLLHRRRRGGRDRPAGHGLARQQVPQPGLRRRRPAHPALERVQDRQPDHPGQDRRRRADLPARRLRLRGHWVSGDDPAEMHQLMAATLDRVIERVTVHPPCGPPLAEEERESRQGRRWPMIVFRSPKGWTGPKTVDGLPVEGTWRVPSGAPGRGADQPRPPGAARIVDAQLPARGAFRRKRRPGRPSWRLCHPGRSSHERQPTFQRRACC